MEEQQLVPSKNPHVPQFHWLTPGSLPKDGHSAWLPLAVKTSLVGHDMQAQSVAVEGLS
jgi:hypothetical protein